MKNILVVSTTSFDYNGISTVIEQLANGLSKEKYNFYYVFANKVNTEKYTQNINKKNTFILKRQLIYSLFYVRKLTKIIVENKIDIVHIHGNSATTYLEVLACKKAKVKKIIVHSHSSSAKHIILHKLFKRKLNNSNIFKIACSINAGNWLFDSNYILLHNAIDINKFVFNEKKRKEYRYKMNINENEIIIGHIGNYSYAKNYELIIDIIDSLSVKNSNFKFLLIGDGKNKVYYENQLVSKNLIDKVILYGKTNEVNYILNAIDIFILPSRFEGYPMSVIEAQTNGLPTLISNKITNEINLSNNVKFIDIYRTNDWIELILSTNTNINNRIKCSNDNYKKLLGSSANIINQIMRVEEIYDE